MKVLVNGMEVTYGDTVHLAPGTTQEDMTGRLLEIDDNGNNIAYRQVYYSEDEEVEAVYCWLCVDARADWGLSENEGFAVEAFVPEDTATCEVCEATIPRSGECIEPA